MACVHGFEQVNSSASRSEARPIRWCAWRPHREPEAGSPEAPLGAVVALAKWLPDPLYGVCDAAGAGRRERAPNQQPKGPANGGCGATRAMSKHRNKSPWRTGFHSDALVAHFEDDEGALQVDGGGSRRRHARARLPTEGSRALPAKLQGLVALAQVNVEIHSAACGGKNSASARVRIDDEGSRAENAPLRPPAGSPAGAAVHAAPRARERAGAEGRRRTVGRELHRVAKERHADLLDALPVRHQNGWKLILHEGKSAAGTEETPNQIDHWKNKRQAAWPRGCAGLRAPQVSARPASGQEQGRSPHIHIGLEVH